MIVNLQHGWAMIRIGNFTERASYLTDVPNDCLDAFIFARENGFPATVHFDAEGYEYYLVASYFDSYIIMEKDDTEIYRISLGLVELGEELISDIESNIDKWANWLFYNEYNEDELKKNKRRLEQKLWKLRQLLGLKG